MHQLLDSLGEFRSKIGWRPAAFLMLAMASITYRDMAVKNAETMLFTSITLASVVLFGLFLVSATSRLFDFSFKTRPGKGLVDGLLAGLLATVLGGFFGWGLNPAHTLLSHPLFVEGQTVYFTAKFTRVMLIVVTGTIPLAVLGLLIDLVHRGYLKSPREQLTGLVAILAVLVGSGSVLIVFAMSSIRVEGIGVGIRNVQLVFEVFIFSMALIHSFEEKFSFKELLMFVSFPILGMLVGRIVTQYVHTPPHLTNYYFEADTVPLSWHTLELPTRLQWSFDNLSSQNIEAATPFLILIFLYSLATLLVFAASDRAVGYLRP